MKKVLFKIGMGLMVAASVAGAGEARNPAVLFTTGLHQNYFTLPMHAEGIELDKAPLAELPARLKSGKYNVVYVASGFDQPAVVAALKEFMAAGGGVLVCYSHFYGTETDWQKRQDFLSEYGAHFAWVDMKENDKSKIVPSSYSVTLFKADQIAAPFNQGVSGLLYHDVAHVAGASTIPLVVDGNWTAAVRASATAEGVPTVAENDAVRRRYVPKETLKSPVLLAVRPVGKGRLAAYSMAPEWVCSAVPNCPPVKEMMTAGVGEAPSHWVRVLANTFRWLSEPGLAAGLGGATTPEALLAPPAKYVPKMTAARDWTKLPPLVDQEQLPGLVGAQSAYSGGSGSAAEWAAAAKKAGLKFLVFLEPLDKISREDYAKLKADCAAATDDTFFACPGLRYQDAYTKTHTFAYGEFVDYPQAKLLTQDGKYLNNPMANYRSRHLFDYVLEQCRYWGQFGYFRHKANPTPPWEYRMYSLFTLYSTEKGQAVDNDFEDYDALQGMQMTLTPLSISLMEKPADISAALKRDWLVVNTAPGEFGDGSYSEEYGTGVAAMRKLFKETIAWSRPFQYITQGPRILCWRADWPVAVASGDEDMFRPDLARYRVRLHATSDAGLKEIRIISQGRVIQRYLPGGAKEFDRIVEFENTQQRCPYPVIEDMDGKKAIGMVARNTTTLWTEFICGDRCNFLNYGMQRGPDGKPHQFSVANSITPNKGSWRLVEIDPTHTLTPNSASLPTDGSLIGNQGTMFAMYPVIDTPGFPQPGRLNCRPENVLSSPDVFIGGATMNKVNADTNNTSDCAWTFFGAVQDNEWVRGRGCHTMFRPLIDGLRVGWYEFDLRAGKNLPLGKSKLGVIFTSMPFDELRDGGGHIFAAGDKTCPPVGSFGKGAYLMKASPGGPVALVSLDAGLSYEIQGNVARIGLCVEGDQIAADTALKARLGYLGGAESRTIADLRRYLTTMSAPLQGVSLAEGKLLAMDSIAMRLDAGRGAVELKLPALDLNARMPVVIANAHPNRDYWLLDKAQPAPNWRQLPKVGDTVYASLPNATAQNLFLGCPVAVDNDELRVSLCSQLPGQWLVTLHNSTDKSITARVRSVPGWTAFKLAEKEYTVPAGSSVDVEAKE